MQNFICRKRTRQGKKYQIPWSLDRARIRDGHVYLRLAGTEGHKSHKQEEENAGRSAGTGKYNSAIGECLQLLQLGITFVSQQRITSVEICRERVGMLQKVSVYGPAHDG